MEPATTNNVSGFSQIVGNMLASWGSFQMTQQYSTSPLLSIVMNIFCFIYILLKRLIHALWYPRVVIFTFIFLKLHNGFIKHVLCLTVTCKGWEADGLHRRIGLMNLIFLGSWEKVLKVWKIQKDFF